MAYEDIAIPTPLQPASAGMFGLKVRSSILDIDARLRLLEGSLSLPPPVKVAPDGSNAISAAANIWQNLPTTPTSVAITNPSSIFEMLCHVFFGAWLQTSAGAVNYSIDVSGGVVSDPTPGDNSPAGWGMLPTSTSVNRQQSMGYFLLVIPPSVAAVTLTGQGLRTNGSATASVSYPTIHCTPFRYQLPA